MTITRLAFLGDIHGNLPALEAVLDDLRAQAPDAVYVTGDLVNRLPWTNPVMDLLRSYNWPTIQGNHDLIIGRIGTPENRPPFNDRRRFPSLWWTWEQLRPEHRAYLRSLPADQLIYLDGAPPIRLFHGLPGDPFQGILPEHPDETVRALVGHFPEPVIVCAHTHRTMDRQVGDKRILNPGSVGLPYNGDPRAQYLILDLVSTPQGPAWQPTFRRVDYDRDQVVEAFHRSGMAQQVGPLGELYIRTVRDALPWASDFGHWLKSQPDELKADLERAVRIYLAHHGPHNWTFPLPQAQPAHQPEGDPT